MSSFTWKWFNVISRLKVKSTFSLFNHFLILLLLSPVKRGDIGFSFSVCPSVRPSVCPSVRLRVQAISPKVLNGFFFKFYTRIEHQWKVCNVVFSFELMKKCESDRTLKTNENLRNIRPRVQAISPKVYIEMLLSIHIRIKHILKVCNVVFWIKLMENCQSYRLLKIHKMR